MGRMAVTIMVVGVLKRMWIGGQFVSSWFSKEYERGNKVINFVEQSY